MREGSTGDIQNRVEILAEEGALFKKRKMIDNRKFTARCLNACDLAALRASHDRNDSEPKTPTKHTMDKLIRQQT